MEKQHALHAPTVLRRGVGCVFWLRALGSFGLTSLVFVDLQKSESNGVFSGFACVMPRSDGDGEVFLL
jgi:hypothetical protein